MAALDASLQAVDEGRYSIHDDTHFPYPMDNFIDAMRALRAQGYTLPETPTTLAEQLLTLDAASDTTMNRARWMAERTRF